MKEGKTQQNKFDTDNTYKYQTGNMLNPLASVQAFNIFPFDLGFSMTVHKAQGRTIPKVVLDITSHPTKKAQMEFAGIFVAMSRVNMNDNMRLLGHSQRNGTCLTMQEAYSHLTKLEANKDVLAFYHGYDKNKNDTDNCGEKWNHHKALNFKR